MAYYNNWNNQQQGEVGNREYAIDWEAKTIPLFAYKNCLILKESFLLSLRGVPDHPAKIAKIRFMAAIITFFDTVEVGFVQHIKSNKYKERPDKYDNVAISIADYEQLMVINADAIHEKKLFLLFRILKNWCFEFGPFQTFSEKEEDVFERLENEDAEL